MKQDNFFRASTRNTVQSPNKYAILEETPTPVRMHFSVHHRAWRSWSCVKLLCLCARLRLGVVPTYYPVNSWPSRSSSCEESLFPCLHTHIVEDFKLTPYNCRCWNSILEIFQNFPFSETHQFRCRYVILWKVKILKKNCLKTSSETRLLSETGFLFSFGFRFAFFYYSGPLIFTTRLKQFEGELTRWTVQF